LPRHWQRLCTWWSPSHGWFREDQEEEEEDADAMAHFLEVRRVTGIVVT